MIVSYNGKWKWPIAYFFKNSMTSVMLAELINTALILTAEVGIKIRSLTFDGRHTNWTALKILECNIFVNNIEDFKHPTLCYNVHAVPDPCHMLKLCRNALAEYLKFFIENLVLNGIIL